MKQKTEKIKLEVCFVNREDADEATLARMDACEEEFRGWLSDKYHEAWWKEWNKRNGATPIHA